MARPKGLNFLDTYQNLLLNKFILGKALEPCPSGCEVFFYFTVYRSADHQRWTETVVVVRIAVRDIRIEHTSISAIVHVATTFDKRFARIQFKPYFEGNF